MQENSRYAVGLDIGTTTVRCVVGHLDDSGGTPTIVGVGSAPNTGMRKGVVSHLQGPSAAIDKALGEAERVSGYQVDAATVSINGQHILSTKADGMIAVGAMDHEVNVEDIARLEEVATVGKIPANREVLQVVPHDYRLDGQDNIKDPIGMTGTRLEVRANVVSVLLPHLNNLEKAADMAKVNAHTIVPAVLAAARSVLDESQVENGVAVVDIGGSTTSVAVFEEGDLQFVSVIPVGGINITNDLAIGLKTDPEVAEKVKLTHARLGNRDGSSGVSVKIGKQTHSFDSSDVDEIVEARLEEVFESVQKELKRAGKSGQLPSGVVLTGGTANIRGIADFAKEQLGLAARVGKPSGFGGVADGVSTPEFATAVGLMLGEAEGDLGSANTGKRNKNVAKKGTLPGKSSLAGATSSVKKMFSRFKF
ncbi:cell division protein FtsA [Candidatus Nomurabacteria bacterium]|nr:cell division protein FtsA [Candidatus Nomurabacteria bacterium]